MRLVRNCAFVRQLADRTRAVIVGPVLQEPALESAKGHGHRRPKIARAPFPPEKIRWKAPPSENAHTPLELLRRTCACERHTRGSR